MNYNSKAVKVAYLLTPVDFGGAEKVSLNIFRYYNRDIFHLEPITLVRPWEKDNFFIGELEKENISCHPLPLAVKREKDFFRVFRCCKLFFSVVKSKRFDLIHTNGYFADIIGIPVAKVMKIPHVATCHGYIENDLKLKLYNKLDMFFLRFAGRIVAVSHVIKSLLIANGVSADKIVVIENSVELPTKSHEKTTKKRWVMRERFAIQDNEVVLGYIGRLSEEKGLLYLLDAVARLIEKGMPFKIILVGEGPQRAELETRVADHGLQNNVIFTGFQQDVSEFLPVFDIFTLPSLTEGTPMALLEAMGAGLPVMASSVGQIPDIIDDGINGVLIQPADQSSIERTLTGLLEKRDLWKSLAERGRDTIDRNYNIKDWIEKFQSIYLELANKS